MPETDDLVALAAANTKRGSVVAAAGCGKTEQLARATLHGAGRRLLLTHTHAGVDALRQRLGDLGVPNNRYKVDTIAGWSLRYASAFPTTSGLLNFQPREGDWGQVYTAAARLITSRAVDSILLATFSGVFVDEYQDCDALQHQLITALADRLPTCIFGDPLQAVFGFDGNRPAWGAILEFFPEVGRLSTPHRWMRAGNEPLAKWLASVRGKLEANEKLDAQARPACVTISALPQDRAARSRAILSECRAAHKEAGSGTLVVIADRASLGSRSDLAKKLSEMGFSAIEPIGNKTLHASARKIGTQTGIERLKALIQLVKSCTSGFYPKEFLVAVEAHLTGRRVGRAKFGSLIDTAARVISENSGAAAADLLEGIRRYDGVKLSSRERYQIVERALKLQSSRDESLEYLVWEVQNRLSQAGRTMGRRCVGSTLLVKGLQFDHAVVVGEKMPKEDWYVAITRASKSLRVLWPTKRSDNGGSGGKDQNPDTV